MYDASENNVMPSTLGLGFTRSRLFLDCVTPSDAGTYSCVAENEYIRRSKSSQLFVVDTLEAENDAICLAKKTFGKYKYKFEDQWAQSPTVMKIA